MYLRVAFVHVFALPLALNVSVVTLWVLRFPGCLLCDVWWLVCVRVVLRTRARVCFSLSLSLSLSLCVCVCVCVCVMCHRRTTAVYSKWGSHYCGFMIGHSLGRMGCILPMPACPL